MDEAFKCQFCGEELTFPTNFKFRLKPAKRMPKKSLKLYHNPRLQLEASSTFNSHHSAFQKYIHRRSFPSNTMQIKCGSCSLISSMSVLKPKYVPTSVTLAPEQTPMVTPSGKGKKRKKKSKRSNDLNAGLILPPSMWSSTPPLPVERIPILTPTPEVKAEKMVQSSLFTVLPGASSFQPTPNSKLVLWQDNSKMSQRMRNKIKRTKEKGEKNRQKEMNQLRKTLFKSKKMSASSSTSLNHFLGHSK